MQSQFSLQGGHRKRQGWALSPSGRNGAPPAKVFSSPVSSVRIPPAIATLAPGFDSFFETEKLEKCLATNSWRFCSAISRERVAGQSSFWCDSRRKSVALCVGTLLVSNKICGTGARCWIVHRQRKRRVYNLQGAICRAHLHARKGSL